MRCFTKSIRCKIFYCLKNLKKTFYMYFFYQNSCTVFIFNNLQTINFFYSQHADKQSMNANFSNLSAKRQMPHHNNLLLPPTSSNHVMTSSNFSKRLLKNSSYCHKSQDKPAILNGITGWWFFFLRLF